MKRLNYIRCTFTTTKLGDLCCMLNSHEKAAAALLESSSGGIDNMVQRLGLASAKASNALDRFMRHFDLADRSIHTLYNGSTEDGIQMLRE